MLHTCPTLSWKDKSFRLQSLNTIRARNWPNAHAVLVLVEGNDKGVACNLGIPWIPWSSEWSSGTGGVEPANWS